jgi:hypothetical protein
MISASISPRPKLLHVQIRQTPFGHDRFEQIPHRRTFSFRSPSGGMVSHAARVSDP